MKKFWEDFKKFISRGNVVDMAVGVAVASAFTAIVTAFTKGFISPILALFTNDADLSSMKLILRPEVSHVDAVTGETIVDTAEVALMWGLFAQAILDFLLVAFVLFIVMRVASAIMKKAKAIRDDMDKTLNEEKYAKEKAKAEAEAREKEEAEAAAKAEAEAKAAAEAEEVARKKTREEEEFQLLREIRDLLKQQSK